MKGLLRRRPPAAPPPPPPAAPHVQAAIDYAEDVIRGEIPACKWVRLACERFQRDLKRSAGNSWAYRLDHQRAERVCCFTELLPHTKGKWASKKETLRLEPWQCFILVNVFGWVHRTTGLRRFRVSLVLVPRKNGKSTLSAPVGLYMLAADKEHGAEVYCGATSEKQAWEVFRPASLMAKGTPALLQQLGIAVNASNINVAGTASRFEPVIGKPGDGASPHCAIVDEFHEHDTSDLWDTMLTGMGAREQPIMFGITTAGSNIGGPCYDQVLTGRKLLQRVLEDDELFYIEWTIDEGDDWTTRESLIKANPNYGVSVGDDFLLARQREAVRNTRHQATFKTKHLNIWVHARDGAFNMESWSRCRRPGLSLDDFEGQRCVIGLDLASKLDIAALQLLFPLEDGRFATFGFYYLPEEAIEDPTKELYRAWAAADPPQLILTDGSMIDFGRIEDDLEELRTRFTVDAVVFDPAQATMLVVRLMQRGVEALQFTQTAVNYSEPFKQVQAKVDAGLLEHDCGPDHPMTWMMSNVTAKLDAKEQIYPRKEKPENKIDGPVALIMAMSQCLAGEAAGTSIYDHAELWEG